MRFANPDILFWLWAIIPLGFILFWLRQRKMKVLYRFAQAPLLAELIKSYDQRKERYKDFLMILVFFFSILALARPQWGFRLEQVKRQGLDMILALDTSKSMLTQDVKPNRLERTKLAARDLIKKLKGDRIGLVAFAGDAFLVCPLTVDYGGFLLTLNDVNVNTIPRGGTNLASAIEEAIKEHDTTPAKYKVVIILSDGENLDQDPLPLAAKAKEKGVRIYCVGIGTPEGELVRVPDETGQHDFLKDENGNFIKSRLNEKLLEQIALTTGGIYVRSSGAEFGLDLIYDRELSKFEKRDIEARMEKRYFERFQIPLGLAFLALVMATLMNNRRKINA